MTSLSSDLPPVPAVDRRPAVLLWAHAALVPLPTAGLPPVRVATSAPDLLGLGPEDVLIVGTPEFAVRLARLPRAALLLSWVAAVVAEARSLGWRALQLPGPDPDAIARAVRCPEALIEVERGTLDLGAGAVWTDAGSEALPQRELEALEVLVRRAPDPVERSAIHKPDSTVRRLRARLGRTHIASERDGLRFRPLAAPPARAVAVPARPPVAIGDTVLDIDGQRVVHPAEELALSPREAAALALLLDAPGVVGRDALAAAMGIAATRRRPLDLAMYRLRAKLAPVELLTVRGSGFRLVRTLARPEAAEEPTGQLDRLLALLATEPWVTVTGPCGVGKSWLARRAAAAVGAAALDLHGVDVRLATRLLSHRVPAGRRVLVDGLDDAAAVGPILRDAVAGGRRLLVTARACAGADGERELRLEPWSVEALRVLDPGAGPEHDGLPLALVDRPELERRLCEVSGEVGAALHALSVFAGPFGEDDAVEAGCAVLPAALARLGWLSAGPPWRLCAPALAALRSRWTPADAARHARIAAVRMRAALDRAPFARGPVRDAYPDLVRAHEATGDPALAVLRADALRELHWDRAALVWLADALARAEDRATRAWLLYFLALGDDDLHLDVLADAADLTDGEQRLEWRLELAYYLGGRGRPDEARAILAEAERELAGKEPDAWVYCRGELAVLQSREWTDHEALVAQYSAVLGQMMAAQWTRADFPAGHRRTRNAQAQIAMLLGRSLRVLGRLDEAEVAFRLALAGYHPDGAAGVLSELGALAMARRRWDEADAWFAKTEAAAERSASPAFAVHALLRRARSWCLRGDAVRGDVLVARAEGLPSWTTHLRKLQVEVRGWRAAALGDPDGVGPVPGVLGEVLGDTARAIRALRDGGDPAVALARVESRLADLAAAAPGAPADVEAVLANAGIVLAARPGVRARR